ncbi:MAG TPA: c-type cytochrome [Hanamia sp.]|nr:c-type cytochrome [Hanamia sp.]
MKSTTITTLFLVLLTALFGVRCNQNESSQNKSTSDSTLSQNDNGGYKNQIEYGKHLVTIVGCNDCHTPKKMTAMGPVPDTSLLLSGHPAKLPFPDVNRKEIESKGLAVTSDLTAWAGPWGISYADNLTPDPTGVGSWTKEQFFTAIREGKWKGMKNNRELLPPMPWQEFSKMTDNELSAIFAYLQSIKPIQNIVPPAAPPVTAPHH